MTVSCPNSDGAGLRVQSSEGRSLPLHLSTLPVQGLQTVHKAGKCEGGERKQEVGSWEVHPATRWVGYEEPEVPGSRGMALLIRASSIRRFLNGV